MVNNLRSIKIRTDLYEELRQRAPYPYASINDTLYSLLQSKTKRRARSK